MNAKTATKTLIAAGALLALLPGGEAGLAKSSRPKTLPEATNTGPAVSCVQITQFHESRVLDSRTIDFMRDSKRGWRNVLPHECPGLTTERAFAYETSLSQLCSTDIIHVLYHMGGTLERGAACGLGKFQPIELKR